MSETRMTGREILKKFKLYKVIITNGHFVYTSGRHGDTYINKDAIYPHTMFTSFLCKELAYGFYVGDIDVVVGPEKGGIILSQWTAYHLTCIYGRQVLAVYAEKTEEGGFTIKRGYDKLIKNKKVLIVEDILTTGSSVRKVIKIVRDNGGRVIGVGALFNRGNVKEEDVGVVPHSITKIKIDSWTEDECLESGPCSKGIPVNTDVGKGLEFIKDKQTAT